MSVTICEWPRWASSIAEDLGPVEAFIEVIDAMGHLEGLRRRTLDRLKEAEAHEQRYQREREAAERELMKANARCAPGRVHVTHLEGELERSARSLLNTQKRREERTAELAEYMGLLAADLERCVVAMDKGIQLTPRRGGPSPEAFTRILRIGETPCTSRYIASAPLVKERRKDAGRLSRSAWGLLGAGLAAAALYTSQYYIDGEALQSAKVLLLQHRFLGPRLSSNDRAQLDAASSIEDIVSIVLRAAERVEVDTAAHPVALLADVVPCDVSMEDNRSLVMVQPSTEARSVTRRFCGEDADIGISLYRRPMHALGPERVFCLEHAIDVEPEQLCAPGTQIELSAVFRFQLGRHSIRWGHALTPRMDARYIVPTLCTASGPHEM